ncbi:uncharacterized protein LOC141695938 [Apium graveolens]|uniref:uncharacterized protein LOC141695938 n=1 Tax=Apium graveolens TaxID=4045 RepID=UPI003D7B03B0
MLHPSIPSWPFMKWGMDIVGKMPPAPGQKVFMLAMTDYFSKWIEVEAFRQVKSKEVISFIKRNVICKFGVPSEITTPKTSTGETPFYLVYGTEIVLPTEIISPTTRYGLATTETNSVERAYDLDMIDEVRDMAKLRMASHQQVVAKSCNKNVHIRTLAIGDLVLRKVFQNTMDTTAGKLGETWEGPYLVDDIVGRGAYNLSTLDGIQVPRSWNILHLKKYHM